MVCIRLPRWGVAIVGLITPRRPTLAGTAPEQFDERSRRARFDNVILLIGLALLFQQTARPFLLQEVPPHTFFVSEPVSRSDESELFLL